MFFFVRYKEAASQPALWLQQSLNTFRESLLDLCQPNRASAHAPLERSPPHQTPTPTNDNHLNANNVLAAQTKQIMDNLMTSCVVLRIENFTLYRVTTSGKKQMPKEFISGKKYRIRSIQFTKQQFCIKWLIKYQFSPLKPFKRKTKNNALKRCTNGKINQVIQSKCILAISD